MPVKLVASDMDGTLLQDDHITISERNLRAIRELIRKGIYFVPASGRMLHFLPQALLDLGGISYAITSNGAAVYDLENGKRLFHTPIEKTDLLKILEIAKEDQYLLEMYCDGQSYIGQSGIQYLETHSFPEQLRLFVEKKRIVVKSLTEFVQRQEVQIEKINFPYLLSGERDQLWKELKSIPGIYMTTSGVDNMELNHRDATKGAALKSLCEFLGMDTADTVAFGDGQNDRELLQQAGIGVAMKNAVSEILPVADRITLTNEEDGVAVFLEENIL